MKAISAVFALCVVLLFGSVARADSITATVPEFNGNFFDFSATYPQPSVLIGTFNYSIPSNDHILGATLSGTFGNSDVNNTTALSDYFIESGAINVAGCDSYSDACFAGAPDFNPVPWTYTFTTNQLSSLLGGSIDFTVVQNSPFTVQTGITTLDINVQPIPEPASILLLCSGIAGLAIRRFKSRAA